MPEEVGSLYVDVTSSGEKVIKDLQQVQELLEKINGINAKANLGDTATDLKSIKSSLQNMKSGTYEFNFKTNADVAAGKVEQLNVALNGIKDNITTPREATFETNASAIKTQVDELKTALASITKGVKKIDFNGNSVANQIRNITNATSKANTAQRTYNGSLRESHGILEQFKNAITIFGTGYLAIMALNSAIGFVKSSFIDFNDTVATAKIGFETILKSADKAKAVLAAVRQYAIETPYSLQGLLPNVQKLFSFGIIDKNLPSSELIKQSLSAMTAIGDASYALGRGSEGVDRVTLALGQMHTATIVNGQDMRQLKEVGIDAWKYLAQATGKSTAEVKQLVHDGLMPANEAIQVMLAGMEREFGGGMARAAHESLGGVLEVFKDTLQSQLANMGKTVYEKFVDIFLHLSDAMDPAQFQKKAQEIGDAISGALVKGLDQAESTLQVVFDLISHNKGMVDAFFTMLLVRFAALAALGGKSSTLAVLAISLGLVSNRTDALGAVARVATPLLWGLTAAVTAYNTAMAIAAVTAYNTAMAIAAVRTSAMAGIGKLSGILKGMQALTSGIGTGMVVQSVGVGGEIATLSQATPLMASIGTTAATALTSVAGLALGIGSIVAVVLTGMTAWQKYKQVQSQLVSTQIDLASASKAAADELANLRKYAGADPKVVDEVNKLADAYNRLHGTPGGINQLQNTVIPALEAQIKVSPKFDEIDRKALREVLKRYQTILDEEKKELEVSIDLKARANPLSLQNIKQAFSETFAGIKKGWSGIFDKATVDGLNQFFDIFLGGWILKTLWAGVKMGGNLVKGIWSAISGASHALYLWAANIGTTSELQTGPNPKMVAAWQKARANRPKNFIGPQAPTAEQIAAMRAQQRTNAEAGEAAKKLRDAISAASGTGKDVAASKAADALKGQLEEAARGYDDMAKAAETSAERQINALKGIGDSLRGIFDSLQKSLVDKGIINNPLGGIIAQFQKSLNLQGQVNAIGAKFSPVIGSYESQANALRARAGASGTNAAGVSLLDAMRKSINTPMGAMACARFVSSWFDKLNIAVKTTDSAKGLIQNAIKAGAKRIPVGQAGAGDLLFMHSKGAPSGYHVGIGAGDGMFAAKNRDRFGKISSYGWQGALDTSALQRFNQSITSGKSAVIDFGNAINSFKGRLSSYFAIQKGWGAAVKNTDQNTARFGMQSFLATEDGQAFLQNMVGKSVVVPSGVKGKNGTRTQVKDLNQAATVARQLANVLDIIYNRATAPQKLADALNAARSSVSDFLKVNQSDVARLKEYNAALKEFGNNKEAIDKRMAVYDIGVAIDKAMSADVFKKMSPTEQETARTKMFLTLWNKFVLGVENGKIEKAAADAEALKKALDDAAESALNASRQASRNLRDANLTPLQVAQNKILDRQADARNQQMDSSVPAALKQWLADASNLTIAAKQTAFNTIADQITKLKTALSDSGGHADDITKSGWLKKLTDLNKEVADFIKKNPLFASLTKDAKKDLEGISKSINGITLATSAYDMELRKLQKAHARTMVKTSLAAGVDDYRDSLATVKGEDGKPLTAAEINKLVNTYRTNKIEENKTSYIKDLTGRLSQSNSLTDWGAQADRLKQSFIDKGFSDADITKFLGKEKWLYIFDQIKGMLNNALGSLYTDGFSGFLHSLENGIGQMLNNLASQILSSYAMKLLTNLMPGLGSVGSINPYGGMISAVAGSILPGHATGLPYVPIDNYVARLHKGEAVLTAQEAQMWRNMSVGVGSGGGGSSSSQGSGSPAVHNYYYYSIGSVAANNPQEFTKKIAGAKVSRSQMSREALGFVGKGRASS